MIFRSIQVKNNECLFVFNVLKYCKLYSILLNNIKITALKIN